MKRWYSGYLKIFRQIIGTFYWKISTRSRNHLSQKQFQTKYSYGLSQNILTAHRPIIHSHYVLIHYLHDVWDWCDGHLSCVTLIWCNRIGQLAGLLWLHGIVTGGTFKPSIKILWSQYVAIILFQNRCFITFPRNIAKTQYLRLKTHSKFLKMECFRKNQVNTLFWRFWKIMSNLWASPSSMKKLSRKHWPFY